MCEEGVFYHYFGTENHLLSCHLVSTILLLMGEFYVDDKCPCKEE